VSKDLELLRSKLHVIDEQLIVLLAERMTVSKRIGRIKEDIGLEIEQKDFWDKKSIERRKLAKDYGLSVQFIDAIFDQIHEESKKVQKF
jgi:chorismate mutase